jgi:hypothetical protein
MSGGQGERTGFLKPLLDEDLDEKQAKLKDAETLAIKGFLYFRCVCLAV